MKPTFHLAPRLSIPPPPNGPLHLGTIIDNLTDVEPLNENCRLPLLGKTYEHHSSGFTATRTQLVSGNYGAWAKFVGLEGIGGELSMLRQTNSEATYRFECLDEITFTATADYVTRSMNERDVKDFIEGTGYEPVYMVTGLKIARGPAVSLSSIRQLGITAEMGLSQSGGIQGLDVGPRVEHTRGSGGSVEFESSDDFVYGFRVKKLRFKRGLLSRKPGAPIGEHHHQGATLVDNDAGSTDESLEPVDSDDEIKENDMEMKRKHRFEGSEEVWIVPE